MKVAVLICIAFASFAAGQSTVKAPPKPTNPPATDAPTDAPTNAPTDAPTDAPTAAATTVVAADPNCQDKQDNCNRYELYNCIGIYEGWAKENCPRYCGYCINPNDTNRVCEDKIPNCNEYQGDTCTDPQYRIFAEDSCAKFCNKCDFRPRYIRALELAPKTTASPVVTTAAPSSGCKDIADYCWNEPDENCFGIYGPWARVNCPFRCGFCPEKPQCVDEIKFCAQFGMDVCTDPQYQGWARKNCRKMCNMCDLPKAPAGEVVIVDATNTGPTVAPTRDSSLSNPILPVGNKTFIGQKSTFVIQGDPSTIPGVCFYQGKVRPLDINWYDGCDYICSCFDAKRNRVICTQRCTQWGNLPAELDGCSLVQESEACCKRLECNV